MYRFRVVQKSTNEIKESWFAVPQISQDQHGNCQFNLKFTTDPDAMLIAENASQAFFMQITMAPELEKNDIVLIVEMCPVAPTKKKIKK